MNKSSNQSYETHLYPVSSKKCEKNNCNPKELIQMIKERTSRTKRKAFYKERDPNYQIKLTPN